MDVKLKVGDKVRATRSHREGVTVGKLYEVKGVEGDIDHACGGIIEAGGFTFLDGEHGWIYSRFPHSAFNDWELVTD